MIQEAIAQLLKDSRGKATRGAKVTAPPVFADYMPAQITTGCFVKAGTEGISIDGEIEGYHKGELQLLARAKTPAEAETLALYGMSVLTIKVETQVGDRYLVKAMRPIGIPRSYPLTPGEQYECAVTFKISYVTLL